ncbi:MAG TPA: hypothetical protein VGO61_22840 [Steroidobacteraceae bacterium]|jgi:hypothetical protein|nr:hypothetical protein [Steroidobacteraceae bacterium]
MAESAPGEFAKRFPTMYELVKLLGFLHICLAGLQLSVTMGEWRTAAIFAVLPLVDVFRDRFRYFWLHVGWFRNSFIAQILIQIVFGILADVRSSRSLGGTGAVLGLCVLLGLMPTIFAFCKEHGIQTRTDQAAS